jgi:hypothetical protein
LGTGEYGVAIHSFDNGILTLITIVDKLLSELWIVLVESNLRDEFSWPGNNIENEFSAVAALFNDRRNCR